MRKSPDCPPFRPNCSQPAAPRLAAQNVNAREEHGVRHAGGAVLQALRLIERKGHVVEPLVIPQAGIQQSGVAIQHLADVRSQTTPLFILQTCSAICFISLIPHSDK